MRTCDPQTLTQPYQKWQAELAERLKRTLEEQKLSLEDENDAQAPPQHDTTEEGPARKKSSKESSRDEFRENSSSQPYSKGSNDNRTSSECKGPKVKSSSISLPARDKKPKVSFRDTEYKPSYAPKVPPHTPLTPLTKEEETWLDLKKLLEETERKAFNTWLYRYRLRKKKQSQLRSAISLPEYLTEYPPTTCRKSWTVCDETETSETSESASEPSLRTGIKKTSIDSMEGEGINVVVDDCCNCFSVPVIVQSSYDDTLETVHNSLMVDMNTDSDSTVRAVSPIPGFKSPMGDAASPVAVFRNVGDSGVIFDQRPDLNTAKKAVESLDEKNEQGKVNNAKQLEASNCRAKLCKSTNPLYMLCQEYRSPFYICTPRLRHKERSSSLPLLSHPELVRSKLRRAVTESPNIQRNVIEEYDADLDDDDLLLEQEEWKGRIYRNILKSMTASAEQNELLLKRIEEQVEGDGDLPSLPHPSSPRRRRSSFSRSADEATVSSSDEATEKQGNLLEVKPRRKRRNSVERRLSIERRKSREHSTDHSTDVSPCLSPCSPRAADPTQGNPLQETCEEEKQKVSRPEIVVEASTGGVEDTSALSTVDETSVTGGELSGNVTDVEPCSALPLYTAPEAERVSDIFLQDAHQNLVGDKNKEAAAVHIEDRGEDWEVKVLQDVLKHFQADYEAQNRAIEERKKIDKRMRMEIKMLETEIAAQRLEMEYLLSTKANANNCSKSQNSTPLKSPLAHSTPLRATPHSTNRSAANKSLSPIQQMLLNRPTDPLNRSMSQTVLK